MITQVEIVDFLSHHDTILKFDVGMNVIVGPNGAGKSSIVDAITFALFGKHTRGVNKSLTRHGTLDGYVRVEFKVGQRDFVVTRKIKNTGATTVLLCEKQNDGALRNIAAGERKQMDESTSREIEEILRMDFEMLQIASIIRQGELAEIIHEIPSKFKSRINNIIGLDELDNAHAGMDNLISQFRASIRAKIGYDDTHLLTLDSEIVNGTESLQTAQSQIAALSESKITLEKKVETLGTRANTMAASIRAQEEWDKRMTELIQYVTPKRDEANSESVRLGNMITECKTALKICDENADVANELDAIKQTAESATSKINSSQIMLASLREKLTMSDKLVLRDGKCPVCDSVVSKLNPLFVKSHINEEIYKINNTLNEQKAIVDDTTPKISQMTRITNNVAESRATLRAHSIDKTSDLTKLEESIIDLKNIHDAAESCISGNWKAARKISPQAKAHCDELALLESKIDSDNTSLDENVQDDLNNARSALDEAISKYGAAAQRVDTLKDDISRNGKLKAELEITSSYIKRLEIIRGVFHRDGVVATSLRSWALNTISVACTEHLAVLDTKINRITLSEQSGKKRSVVITCHAGNDSFEIDSLSGGEQICVALALRLGMIRLLGSNDPPFVILDEPTAHLDADRRKSVAHVLAGLAGSIESGAMQFIIITHDKDIFDQIPVERYYELQSSGNKTIVHAQ